MNINVDKVHLDKEGCVSHIEGTTDDGRRYVKMAGGTEYVFVEHGDGGGSWIPVEEWDGARDEWGRKDPWGQRHAGTGYIDPKLKLFLDGDPEVDLRPVEVTGVWRVYLYLRPLRWQGEPEGFANYQAWTVAANHSHEAEEMACNAAFWVTNERQVAAHRVEYVGPYNSDNLRLTGFKELE